MDDSMLGGNNFLSNHHNNYGNYGNMQHGNGGMYRNTAPNFMRQQQQQQVGRQQNENNFSVSFADSCQMCWL